MWQRPLDLTGSWKVQLGGTVCLLVPALPAVRKADIKKRDGGGCF